MPSLATRNRRSPSAPLLLVALLGLIFTVGCGEEAGQGTDADGVDRPTFEFQPGDSVCLVGNALAERMQHFGWTETLLQHALPEHELSFRNLGFGADEVTTRQRTQGFGTMDEHLARCEASVVFCFFGFNESFAGERGGAAFEADLEAFVRHLRSSDFSGRGAPRIVLFTPPPPEDLANDHLPDPARVRERLAPYAAAIERVAAQEGVFVVDLFHALDDELAGPDDMSLNGTQLVEGGYEALARETLAAFGLGVEASSAALERTRAAVVAKNEFWFQRYRATDGYNVYGGRSSLSYDGVTNFEVLQQELVYLDELTRRHTAHIHSLAAGAPQSIDLAGLPPLMPVETNIPGPNPDGSHVFKGGEEAIADMRPGPGLEIELFASEERFPELVNPVQMSWDDRGRLWVAVWPDYPHWRPDQPMNDKLLILEDEDGDGAADSCKVFADRLVNPTGFEFWQGGVYVANAPDLLFLEDRNSDDVADVRTRVLHGLSSADTHHAANSFVVGPDGALYFQEGTFHQSQIETVHGPVRNNNGCVWRFEPRTWRVERHVAYNFANPHGHVFDRWGQDFVTDGTGNQNYYALPFSGHVVHPDKHRGYGTFFPQRIRPAAATELISSELFGPEYENDYLIANVIGFRGILRYQLHDDGSGFGATEVDPIVESSDTNFRPVDLEVGPDGALYFLDWHNPIIGHMQHHLRDPNRDRSHGRVYRVAPSGKQPAKRKSLAGLPIAELVDLLGDPEYRVRYRARAALSARPADEVVPVARARAAALGETDEHLALELLWLQQQFDELDVALLRRCLSARDFRARAAAVRVLRGMRHEIGDALALIEQAAGDENPRVRLEAVVAASFFDSSAAAGAALVAVEKPLDRFLSYALKETLRTLAPRWRAAVKSGDLVARTPRAQDYLLQQVDPADLAGLPRVPAVWRAELTSNEVSAKVRARALEGLAAASDRNPAMIVLEGVRTVDASASEHKPHILGELNGLLQQSLDGGDEQLSSALASLRQDAKSREALFIAFAAEAALAGDLETAIAEARESSAALETFLGMIPYIANAELRAAAWPFIRPLAFDPAALSLRNDDRLLPGLRATYSSAVPKSAALESMAGLVAEWSGRLDQVVLPAELVGRSDTFSMRFEGQLRVPRSGPYRFFTRSDDGSMLYVDGELVVANDGPHGPVERSGEIALEEGLHDLVVTFFDQGGGQTLQAFWQGPEFEKEEIPASALVTAAESGISAAALRAMASGPGRSEQKLRDAARLIAANLQVEEAVALAASSDEKERQATDIRNVIDSVVGMAAALPVERRTDADVLAAIELGRKLAPALPASEAAEARKLLDGLGGAIILVRTLPHQMRYDRREIWVEKGKPVALVFQNNDAMPHNLVITEGGALQRVGEAAEKLSPTNPGPRGEYIPDTDEVLFNTPLLKPGDSVRLQFVAPEEAGDLDYVCTFPGHWRVMNGVIHVVDSMAGYDNLSFDGEACVGTSAREFVKNWTPEEVATFFDGAWRTDRSLEAGRRLFNDVGCAQCHRYGDDGDARNIDLAAIGTKYRGAELLSHVIEPSKSILEGYANTLFAYEDRRPVIGRVIREDSASVWVNQTIQDPDDIVEVSKAEVVERKPLLLSPMPTGLLVTLTKEDILDLVNFLESKSR